MDKCGRRGGMYMTTFFGILVTIGVICTTVLWIHILKKPKLNKELEKIRFHSNFLGSGIGYFFKYTLYIIIVILIGFIVYSLINKEYDDILRILNPLVLISINMITICSEYIITTEGIGKAVFGRRIAFYNWKDIIVFKLVGKKRIYFEVIDEKGVKREFNQYFTNREFEERVEYLNEHVLFDSK